MIGFLHAVPRATAVLTLAVTFVLTSRALDVAFSHHACGGAPVRRAGNARGSTCACVVVRFARVAAEMRTGVALGRAVRTVTGRSAVECHGTSSAAPSARVDALVIDTRAVAHVEAGTAPEATFRAVAGGVGVVGRRAGIACGAAIRDLRVRNAVPHAIVLAGGAGAVACLGAADASAGADLRTAGTATAALGAVAGRRASHGGLARHAGRAARLGIRVAGAAVAAAMKAGIALQIAFVAVAGGDALR